MTIFFDVNSPIKFEGTSTQNPLAFRYYDANRLVGNKTMRDHLRFAVAYWHTLNGNGTDVFGEGTCNRTWSGESLAHHIQKMEAAFEFFTKLGAPYWCFHDRDIAPAGKNFSEATRNLKEIVKVAKKMQNETGVKLLWGTANLFSNQRFKHGAATSPDAKVFAYAAAQVKNALDATLELGGENYVFWGGREGYESLINTNYGLEQDLLAKFFHMAVDYKKEIGFKGPFLIEPKPKEPTKHQYDFDSATVIGFLNKYGLSEHFKLNIEVNHATLAGHTFEHELTVASHNKMLGSLDVNTGDPQLGWDTDQFLTDTKTATLAMLIILQQGGLGSGGMNFDAKLRRGSTDLNDLFYAHISGMDTMAKALLIAHDIIENGKLPQMVADRYASYQTGIGEKIIKGKTNFKQLEEFILNETESPVASGKQELFELTLQRAMDLY